MSQAKRTRAPAIGSGAIAVERVHAALRQTADRHRRASFLQKRFLVHRGCPMRSEPAHRPTVPEQLPSKGYMYICIYMKTSSARQPRPGAPPGFIFTEKVPCPQGMFQSKFARAQANGSGAIAVERVHVYMHIYENQFGPSAPTRGAAGLHFYRKGSLSTGDVPVQVRTRTGQRFRRYCRRKGTCIYAYI